MLHLNSFSTSLHSSAYWFSLQIHHNNNISLL